MPTDEASRVRNIIEDWAEAVSSGDRDAILANHADDLLMYDFPTTVRGLPAYASTWDFFYANPRGPISFEPHDLEVTASGDVAFATCVIRCDGTSAGPLELRLTTGLQRIDGEWVITHEHHSVPTVEERFLQPTNESA
jgi:ketosteroid isomerase-like protein